MKPIGFDSDNPGGMNLPGLFFIVLVVALIGILAGGCKVKHTKHAGVIHKRQVSERFKVPPAVDGLREISRAPGFKYSVALTFDGGADSKPVFAILKTLKANKAHATFFLTGEWCERNRGLVRRIARDGHEIANHTYSHPDLCKCSKQEIRNQLSRCGKLIKDSTGRSCVPLYRPPFGNRDKRVIQAALDCGYITVYWSLDSWDSFKTGITSREITHRVVSKVKGGDVVLLHCGSEATAKALPGILSALKARGYRVVAISKLLKKAGTK